MSHEALFLWAVIMSVAAAIVLLLAIVGVAIHSLGELDRKHWEK